jgi:hypothetical protein
MSLLPHTRLPNLTTLPYSTPVQPANRTDSTISFGKTFRLLEDPWFIEYIANLFAVIVTPILPTSFDYPYVYLFNHVFK